MSQIPEKLNNAVLFYFLVTADKVTIFTSLFQKYLLASTQVWPPALLRKRSIAGAFLRTW